MLSRKDIYKQLGKGINIVPFNNKNVKENSINVTISECAWAQGHGIVDWLGANSFRKGNKKNKNVKYSKTFQKGSKAIFSVNENGKEKKYLILLPHNTTIIETLEVIGLGDNIGGSVHSKVGIVAKGIGDTGTMLGPGYCGHLMVSLHNITDDVIALPVGSTFVSLTFDYLNTPVVRTSTTSSSHYDKLLEYGAKLSNEEKIYFTEDWKSNIIGVREKMLSLIEFKEHKKQQNKKVLKNIMQYFNKKNIIIVLIAAFIVFLLFLLACYLDKKNGNNFFVDKFINVGFSGFLGSIIIALLGSLKYNR